MRWKPQEGSKLKRDVSGLGLQQALSADHVGYRRDGGWELGAQCCGHLTGPGCMVAPTSVEKWLDSGSVLNVMAPDLLVR